MPSRTQIQVHMRSFEGQKKNEGKQIEISCENEGGSCRGKARLGMYIASTVTNKCILVVK